MKEKLISFFKEKELLASPDALDALLKKEDPLKAAMEVAGRTDNLFIGLADVEPPKEEPAGKPKSPVGKVAFKPDAKGIEPRIKEFSEYDVTGKSTSSGSVDDFVALFNDRFERLASLLRSRGNVTRDIDTLKKRGADKAVRVIGMVSNVRTTKNGHRFIIIEDPTSSLNVLVLEKNKRLIRESYNIVPDEVIAVEGVLRRDLFLANNIYFPEVPAREPKRADEEVYLAMISDTHVGSTLFLEKKFQKFLNWLNGKEGSERYRKLAGKVKYITIAGDLVDGVGIYPGQEDELETENIFDQYNRFAKLISQIPDHIEIIAIPGNHDATRIAEPQPAIHQDALGELADMPNFRCLGNPGYVALHRVEVMLYHGASIHSMVPHVVEATYEKPEKTILEWLRRRHLHPVYGEKPPICPENRDYLVIERVPDILHVGDVHKNGYLTYRGVIGVNSGTWQNITPYQVKLGHNPTPCILPLMNLQTGKLSVIHFEEGLA